MQKLNGFVLVGLPQVGHGEVDWKTILLLVAKVTVDHGVFLCEAIVVLNSMELLLFGWIRTADQFSKLQGIYRHTRPDLLISLLDPEGVLLNIFGFFR